MSKDFTVSSSVHDYQVNFVDDFVPHLKASIAPGDTLLIDSNVYDLHRERFADIGDDVPKIFLTPSEEMKSYTNVGTILHQLIEHGFRKNHKLIAIGGGITQDIATFIAANIYRGVKWCFFPTSLLAQADSCIGGKASVNFDSYKNLLGNFYPPNEIFIDTSFIDTLPMKEIISGLGEMTHFFFVSSEADYELMRDKNMPARTDKNELEILIHRSLSIKKATIEIDEFDRKERLVFNYGHSFGHAIESITNYGVPHGIAVSHGMDIANFISVKLGLISEDVRQKMRDVLMLHWDEVPVGDIDVEQFIGALRKDKKNIGSDVRVILTRGFGDMFITTLDVDGPGRGWITEYFKEQLYRG